MKPQILSEQDFYGFKPEIPFASDSTKYKSLVGIWRNDEGMIGFDYEVRQKGHKPIREHGFTTAIRKYNEI